MFQDSLLIIKCDYTSKRKTLLIYLLRQGFQIQGHRKVMFSPELAAEFYQDMSEDPCFMFQVILLSKGPSEAFILAKECAVEDLVNSLVCYFGNSVEMEKNVHVTRCLGKVRREICFIFPNYIFEPIYCPEQAKFCSDNPLVSSIINEVYHIVTTPERDPHKSWKEKLADWLILSNKALPRVSNECSTNAAALNVREIAQQTNVTAFKHGPTLAAKGSETNGMGFDTDGTSLNITSSSCVTCSAFGSGDECVQQQQPMVDIIKARTVPLVVSKTSSSTDDMKVAREVHDQNDWMAGDFEEEEPVLDDAKALDITVSNDGVDIVVPGSENAGAGDASTTLVADEKATTGVDDDTGQRQTEDQREIVVSLQQVEEAELSPQPEKEPDIVSQPAEEDSPTPTHVDNQPESDNAPEEPQQLAE